MNNIVLCSVDCVWSFADFFCVIQGVDHCWIALVCCRSMRSALPHSVWGASFLAMLMWFSFLAILRTVFCQISSAASSCNMLTAFSTLPRISAVGNTKGEMAKFRPFAKSEWIASPSGVLLRFTTAFMADVVEWCWAVCRHWNLLHGLVLFSEETWELFSEVMLLIRALSAVDNSAASCRWVCNRTREISSSFSAEWSELSCREGWGWCTCSSFSWPHSETDVVAEGSGELCYGLCTSVGRTGKSIS